MHTSASAPASSPGSTQRGASPSPVGPVWQGGAHGEDALLASCYRTALAIAEAHGLRSIAFPAISCGVYAFPVERAADVVMKTLAEELPRRRTLERVVFAMREGVVEAAFRRALDRALSGG